MNLPRAIDAARDAVSDSDPLPPEDRAARPAPPRLDELYRNQRARLFRLFARRASNDEAHDLVQETFSRFARRAEDGTDEVTEPEAYLTTVATNLLRDRAKFAVRRATAYHQTFDDATMAGRHPIDQLEARDELRRLDAAVQRLKPRMRQVFLLQRVEGMTYAQIAESTGVSVKSVKKQMAKALFELRRDFGRS